MNAEAGREQPVWVPRDLPVIERSAVRIVLTDALDTILLLHTRDSHVPEAGTWWELPGGGIEPEETYLDAALRELAQETGIRAEPSQVDPPSWTRRASFRYRENRHIQDEVVVRVRLTGPGPKVDGTLRLDHEQEDYFSFRWWRARDDMRSGERFYPGRLPALLGSFLAGNRIDEPFELWS